MVELERDVVQRPAVEGARVIALRLLDEAAAALARLRHHEDEEALHDLRVALRRLRCTLTCYCDWLERDATRDALERAGRLASRTGAARDAEVQRAWLLATRDALRPAERAVADDLAAQLEAHASGARAHAARDLAKRFAELERGLRESLTSYRARVELPGASRPPSLACAAADALRGAAAELERALAEIDAAGGPAAEHHARISAKQLRYLIEPLRRQTDDAAALVDDLKGLQDLLGERNDRAVLAGVLRAALERAALATVQGLAAAVAERDEHAEHRLRARPTENALIALLRRARDESLAYGAELESTWLRGKSEPFFARVAELAAELVRMGAGDTEIERKYLLRELPARVRGAEATLIEQGYLPGATVRERLRRATGPRGTRFTRTVKLGTGVVRAEFEEELAPLEFERLWSLTEGARVRKRRYAIPDGELVFEIDEFTDRALWLAEVELPSADTEVVLPEWLAPYVVREVTAEPEFTNLALATSRTISATSSQ